MSALVGPASLAAYDTVICTHALCTAADLDAALQRVDELLAPGGQVLLLEHVRRPGLRGIAQDAATLLWQRTPGGCHANRDVVAALRRNGFAVTDCDRFSLRTPLPMVAAQISAVAVRKAKPPVEDDSE